MNPEDNKAKERHETAEEHLHRLIKLAGEDARAKKKKAMDLHYKKLQEAIDAGTANRQKHNNS